MEAASFERHGGRALLARRRGWRCHMQAHLRPSDGPGRFSNATTPHECRSSGKRGPRLQPGCGRAPGVHHGRAQRVHSGGRSQLMSSTRRTHVGSRPTALSPRLSTLSDTAQASLPGCRRRGERAWRRLRRTASSSSALHPLYRTDAAQKESASCSRHWLSLRGEQLEPLCTTT